MKSWVAGYFLKRKVLRLVDNSTVGNHNGLSTASYHWTISSNTIKIPIPRVLLTAANLRFFQL